MNKDEAMQYLFGDPSESASDGVKDISTKDLKCEAFQALIGIVTDDEWDAINKRWKKSYGPHRGDLVPFSKGEIDEAEFLARYQFKRRNYKEKTGRAASSIDKNGYDKLPKLAARLMFLRKLATYNAVRRAETKARNDILELLLPYRSRSRIYDWLQALN